MQVQKAKKIGLFTAISMLVASVIGIGIFLKNNGVFRVNDGNAAGILIAWIIGVIIALTSAYSFAEVSTSNPGNAGLGGWAEKLLGKKFGYFVKFNLPSFYLSLLGAILTFFLGESFFVIIGQEGAHFGFIALFALLMGIFIYILNYFSIRLSGWVSIVANVAKFIPIVAIIITSVIVSIVRNNAGLFDPNYESDIINAGPINVTGILAAIPAILFAFDSFLIVGNIAGDIKNPRKNVPLAIVAGMIFVGVVYILITIGQLLVGNGNALSFFTNLFPESGALTSVLTVIMNVIIFIAVYGVNSSIAAGTIRSHAVLINEKIAFYHVPVSHLADRIFAEKKNENSSGLVIALIFFYIYWLIILIPSLAKGAMGNDQYVDWISNFPTLFFFLIYGVVIMGGVINRFTNKVEVTKYKGFLPIGIIASILILFIFGYQFFYANIAIPIMDPNGGTGAGVFHNPGSLYFGWAAPKMTNLEGALIFFAFLLWFIAFPFVNLGARKLLNMEKLF